MKDHPDEVWALLRQEAALPEPPAWLAVRTVARLRQEQAARARWQSQWRWIWTGALASVLIVTGWVGWQYHQAQERSLSAQIAALDLFVNSNTEVNGEETWFTSY